MFVEAYTFFFLLLFQITEDLNTDPESDSDHFMNVLIESLSLLGKIPEALEVHCTLKERVIQSCIINYRSCLIVKICMHHEH